MPLLILLYSCIRREGNCRDACARRKGGSMEKGLLTLRVLIESVQVDGCAPREGLRLVFWVRVRVDFRAEVRFSVAVRVRCVKLPVLFCKLLAKR